MEIVTIDDPIDCHVHVRDGPVMRAVVPATAIVFSRVVIMPNREDPHPVFTGYQALGYKKDIEGCVGAEAWPFEPLMTIYVAQGQVVTTPEMIFDAASKGVVAAKFYPRGQTTNSQFGISDYSALDPVLGAMQEVDMVACFHCQSTEVGLSDLEREAKFVSTLESIAFRFPRLRIVFEHVSTKLGVELVTSFHNVVATVTLQHLVQTVDDVLGQPHHYCQPPQQYPKDRQAIQDVVFAGNKDFIFGSDSAPHLEVFKLYRPGKRPNTGVYSAPVILPKAAEVFEQAGKLELLPNFFSTFGNQFYRQKPLGRKVVLVKEPMRVPDRYSVGNDWLVPMLAGQEIAWSISRPGIIGWENEPI